MYETLLLISQALRSKLSLSEAIRLSILDRPDGSNSRQRALLRFADELDKGLDIPNAAAMAGLPRKLTHLLDAAQKSGDFPDYLAELTVAEQAKTKTIQHLTDIASYPLFLLLVMALSLFLTLFLSLQFESVFEDFGMELPVMTVLTLAGAHILYEPQTWYILGGGLLGLLVVQRLLFPAFWFYVPVIGQIFWTLAVEKLIRQIVASLRLHRPLDEAFRLAARSFRFNRSLYKKCLQAADLAGDGTKLSTLIAIYPLLFPAWLQPLVRMAEKNDSIPNALRHGLDVLEEERSGSTLILATAVVPFVCFAFLSLVGFFVTAMFLPLIKLITTLSS